ncbi:MAG TPA: hypothetical protein VFA75_11710 [Nevskia sp.]|nr:hypothetical protein [Nevskia sp.]
MTAGPEHKPQRAAAPAAGLRGGLGLRASTVLLLLAMCGMVLRLSGAAGWLMHVSTVVGLVLGTLAPVWAVCGSMAASVYLMLSMARPYSALQHLAEMACGVLLIVLMLPVF